MTDLEKVARMAVEAQGRYEREIHEKAITTLRQALEQPKQRWAVFCAGCRKEWSVPYQHPGKSVCNKCETTLRQALSNSVEQPARKPWVGLTEKEKREARNSVSYSPLAMTMSEWTEAVQDATEAKLKEKNK